MKSMVSITSRLPQEIIDSIIDCCSLSRDLKILRKCALVSRAFLPRSQQHIFLVIKISCAIQWGKIRTGGRRLDDLYDILQHSHHIGGYVREIRLVVNDNNSWVVGNPKFEWIMDHLTRNTVFNRFHFDGHSSGGLIAPSHLQLFENSFSQRYIVPYITSLKLYRVKNVPISLLVGSPRLKRLTLIRTTLGDIETRKRSLNNTTLPKLHEFYFHRCSETVSALLGNPQNGSPPLLDLSSLYRLSVNQDSLADIQCAMRIIKMTSRSLKHINFIHRNSNGMPFFFLVYNE
ncbi:hypothetical protein BYT27DRAFT_6663354 [Phlegmacium glaucopus]|nr:hypothetical protein BYT27DRAFT_6663354 [Phlegmacium glaucopus]